MDKFWQEAANAMDANGIRIGPGELVRNLKNAYSYSDLREKDVSILRDGFSIAIHKGLLDEIADEFLIGSCLSGDVVFSNDVFVVLKSRKGALDMFSESHVMALFKSFKGHLSRSDATKQILQQRRQAVYLGGGTLLSTLTSGDKIFLDGDDLSLTPHLALDGYWVQWVTDVFLRTMRPGMKVVDIGANCGYFSLLACRAVGEQGFVWAVDANPRMCELVSKSMNVNGYRQRSEVVNMAVMAEPSSVRLVIPRQLKGSATFLRADVDPESFGGGSDVIDVRGAPLTEVVGDATIDFIKIDAEGAEPLIFQGARKVIERSTNIKMIVEFAPSNFQTQSSPDDFLDLIESMGLRIGLISHAGEVRPFKRSDATGMEYCDLFLDRP